MPSLPPQACGLGRCASTFQEAPERRSQLGGRAASFQHSSARSAVRPRWLPGTGLELERRAQRWAQTPTAASRWFCKGCHSRRSGGSSIWLSSRVDLSCLRRSSSTAAGPSSSGSWAWEAFWRIRRWRPHPGLRRDRTPERLEAYLCGPGQTTSTAAKRCIVPTRSWRLAGERGLVG